MTSALIAALIALRDSGKLRWFDGMQYVEPSRRCRRPTCEKHRDLPEFDPKDTYRDRHRRTAPAVVGAIPDLDDPLTAAGMLLVAREVRQRPNGCVFPVARCPEGLLWRWVDDPFVCGVGAGTFYGKSETEALVAAILAAPEK